MRAFMIRMSDVNRCPIKSLSPAHYRDDGTCRCEEAISRRVVLEVDMDGERP